MDDLQKKIDVITNAVGLSWKGGRVPDDDLAPILVACDAFLEEDRETASRILQEGGCSVVGSHIFSNGPTRDVSVAAEMVSILAQNIAKEENWERSVLILAGEDDTATSPVTDIEAHVASGEIIESLRDRQFVQDGIDACDPYGWSPKIGKYRDGDVDPMVRAIWERLESVRDVSRENEGGDGWESSSCMGYGDEEYDNWLQSGC